MEILAGKDYVFGILLLGVTGTIRKRFMRQIVGKSTELNSPDKAVRALAMICIDAGTFLCSTSDKEEGDTGKEKVGIGVAAREANLPY